MKSKTKKGGCPIICLIYHWPADRIIKGALANGAIPRLMLDAPETEDKISISVFLHTDIPITPHNFVVGSTCQLLKSLDGVREFLNALQGQDHIHFAFARSAPDGAHTVFWESVSGVADATEWDVNG